MNLQCQIRFLVMMGRALKLQLAGSAVFSIQSASGSELIMHFLPKSLHKYRKLA
jgi:hypothetical protein